MRTRRRGVALGLVVFVSFFSALVGFLGAQPAQALGVCPSGATPKMIPGTDWVNCIDMAGTSVGRLAPNSNTLTKAWPAGTPTSLTVPSSALSAANGSGGTPTQNVNAAMANGDPNGGGKIGLGTRVMQYGTAIVSAAGTGYLIGQQIDSIACDWGVSALCYPSKSQTIQPNGDAIATAPGFTTQTTSVTQTVSGGTCTWTENVGRASGSTPPTYGSTTSTGSQWAAIFTATFSFTGTCGSSVHALAIRPICVTGHAVQGSGGGQWTTANGSSRVAGQPYNESGFATTGGMTCSGLGGIEGVRFLEVANGGSFSPLMSFYLQGSSLYPPGTTGNPARTLVTTNDCVDGSGNHSSTTASSTSFTETDSTYPAFPVAPVCPTGTSLAGSKVVETSPGLPDKTIWQVTVPTAVKNWQQTYPQCGDGSCRLGLWKVNGTDHLNCFTKSSQCADWFSDPNKSTNYQCTYGAGGSTTYAASQVVTLSECNVYAPTFNDEKVAQGQRYGDPSDGRSPDPGTDPSSGDDPAGLPGSAGVSCWPSGWGILNPAAWVLQPIKCALVWAFVPDTSTLTSLKTSIGTAIDQSAVGPWVNALGGLLPSAPSTDGCDGPAVTFPGTSPPTTIHPFSACDEPMATVAGIARAVVTVVAIIAGGYACLGAIEAGFGFNE